MEKEAPTLHSLPTRPFRGYGVWDLNRILSLTVPLVLGLSMMFILPGGRFWLLMGFITGMLLVLLPPMGGEYMYERLIEKFNSLHIDIWLKGIILRPYDGTDEHTERKLGKVAPFTLQIISDDERSGELLGMLSSTGPKSETIYLMLEPNFSAAYMDEKDRYNYDNRFEEIVMGLTPLIDEASVMAIQVPFDVVPVNEHYTNGRLYLGEDVPLNGFDPLQIQVINHLEAIQDTIVSVQPHTLYVLAIRVTSATAWEGSRPEWYKMSDWNLSPLHDVLQTASNIAQKLGVKVRIPTAMELFTIIRASINPVEAPGIYEQWHKDAQADGSALDTQTYLQGPWPDQITVNSDGIKCGRSTHAFLEVTGFRGFGKIHPGDWDRLQLYWDSGSYITHILDYQIKGAKAEEYRLQFMTDFRQQREESSGLFRPKRQAKNQATEDAYATVALSGKMVRASWHIRITASSDAQRDWLLKQVQKEVDIAGCTSHRVKVSSRLVKCLARSIGCGPQ